jgi:uncharacterized LabA/DUF88 family protein
LNGSDRLKIAVFIDFDNIEIGVKSTLNRHFDVGTVLEAVKERGEVVTKIAYGDWKRSGEHSRSLTQHAVQMVQRNLTPGGDKNGADINLALDALEMAFTRNHINAFVIVGGDSDFMALVEKLKQYDKKVIVVGGRAFTSVILQKNCHEFIAYENLIPQQPARRPAERTRSAGTPAASGDADISKAIPLIRRALKVLSDREVSPQLGLLKSTLLQLDSTFTERDYHANTFRDFIEKVAAAGYVHLKQVDRSLLVELADKESPDLQEEHGSSVPEAATPPADNRPHQPHRQAHHQPVSRHAGHPQQDPAEHPGPPPTPLSPEQIEEGVRAFFEVFQNARSTPHWPMYLRNVKNFIKNVSPSFDERKYGFVNFLEAVRACGRAGLFRLERNRQGILRIFAGPQYPHRGVGGEMEVVGEAPQLLDVANEAPMDVDEATGIMEPIEVNGSASGIEAAELPQEEAAEAPEETPTEEMEVAAAAPKRRTRASSAGARKKPAASRRKKKTADSE